MNHKEVKNKLISLVQNRRSDLLLALYVPVYLAVFAFAEAVVPSEGYWVSYLPIDDLIPFVGSAVIFYGLWFPYLLATGIYLFCVDPPAYRRYLYFMMIGFSGALTFCLLVPNGQNLRPAQFAVENIFTRIVQMVYRVDTCTNVFPSIHVIGSIMAAIAWFDCEKLRRYRWHSALLAALICLSTVLIKQHSALDVIGGVLVSIPIFLIVYYRRFFIRVRQRTGADLSLE